MNATCTVRFARESILYLDLTSVIEPGILAPPKKLAAKEAPSRARRQVRPGDILVSTVRPNLRGFARVPEAPRNLVASTGFAVVSPRRIVNGSFVYQHVMTSQFAQFLENAATGQAYPAVLASDVAGFRLPVPPLPEQRAIAAVLDSIDEAIERTEAVIAITERLRDALLHELLTRGVPGWHSRVEGSPGHRDGASVLGGGAAGMKDYTHVGGVHTPEAARSAVTDLVTEYTFAKRTVLNLPEIHPIPAQWTTAPAKMASCGDLLFCVRGANRLGRMNWANSDYAIQRSRSRRSETSRRYSIPEIAIFGHLSKVCCRGS